MHGTGCRHRTVCRRDFGGSGSHGRHKTRFGNRRELLGIRRPHHVVGGIRRRRRCGELQGFADCKFFFRTIEHNRSRRDAGIAVIVRAGGQSAGRKCEKQEFFHRSSDFKYVRKIKNPVPEPPGIEPFSRPYPYFSHEIPRLAMLRSPQTHPEKRFFLVGKLQGRSSGSSLPQRLPDPLGPVAFSVSRQLSELTAAGTAADFHGIPI